MAKQTKPEGNLVKKQTMLIVALVTLVIGFLIGIFYSAFQTDPSRDVQTASVPAGPPQQEQTQPNLSDKQARKILSLEQEVAINPTNVGAWTQLGHVYYDTANFSKAIWAYEKSLELSPGNPNVLTDLGTMYRQNNQPEKALAAYDKAIAIDPNHIQSRFNKGLVLLYNLNDRDGAVKAWEDLLKVDPDALAPNGQLVSELIKSL